MRRRRLMVLLLPVLVAACGSTKYVTSTATESTTVTTTQTKHVVHVVHAPAQTVTQTETQTSTAASPAFSASSGGGQTFSGTSAQNIGTIHVAKASELHWSCPSCGGANFQINNSGADSSTIVVNALDQTSGQTYLDPGVYHDVTINTEGSDWTITINPG